MVNWLKLKNIKHWHIPQETFTKSWKQKTRNKQAGVNKGISDYLIVIEKHMSKYDRQIVLWLELKKSKKVLTRKSSRGVAGDLVPQNEPTPEQIDFINLIKQSADTEAQVCYGFSEAYEFISGRIK